jgi:hypothetical protein
MEFHFPISQDSRATSNTIAVDPQLDSRRQRFFGLQSRKRQHFAGVRTVACYRA